MFEQFICYFQFKCGFVLVLSSNFNQRFEDTLCAKLNKHSMQQFDKLYIQCLVMKKNFMPGVGTRI